MQDVDLVVPRRGHVAIVGPSGAGKTTLFSLILRFLEPQAGRIELDGRPYTEWSHAEVRDRLAYVEQETPVVPGTIRDNVLLGRPDATAEDVARVMREVRLEHLDLDADRCRRPTSPAASASGSRSRGRSCAPRTC